MSATAGSARALRLVPAALYDRLLEEHLKREQGGNAPPPPPSGPTSSGSSRPASGQYTRDIPAKGELVFDDFEELEMQKKELVDAVVDLLPRPYKRKGRVLLQTAGINLQKNSLRVLYPGDPPELGSHAVDLLIPLLAPPMIRRRLKHRPHDLEKFRQLVSSNASIPQSVLGARRRSQRPKGKRPAGRLPAKKPKRAAVKKQLSSTWLR